MLARGNSGRKTGKTGESGESGLEKIPLSTESEM